MREQISEELTTPVVMLPTDILYCDHSIIVTSKTEQRSMIFKILWCINALVSLIIVYFFFEGLADGSVSSGNMGLWLIILSILTAVMLGSIWLNNHSHRALAITTLCLLAVPSLLYGIFILIFILSGAKWN